MISESIRNKLLQSAIASEGIGRRKNFKLSAGLLSSTQRLVNVKSPLYKTHPILSTLSDWPYLHAETNAIISYGMDFCRHLDLAVARVTLDEKPTMSKPCRVCQEIIERVGIRNVWYTDWNGEWICEKITH